MRKYDYAILVLYIVAIVGAIMFILNISKLNNYYSEQGKKITDHEYISSLKIVDSDALIELYILQDTLEGRNWLMRGSIDAKNLETISLKSGDMEIKNLDKSFLMIVLEDDIPLEVSNSRHVKYLSDEEFEQKNHKFVSYEL